MVFADSTSHLTQTGNYANSYASSFNFTSTLSPDSNWIQTTNEGQLFSTVNDTNATKSPEQCQAEMENFRKINLMIFDSAWMARVLVTWLVFLLSAVGNCFVLARIAMKKPRTPVLRPQLMMMMHLTFANLAFTVFVILHDAIWQTEIEWFGGDALCRVTNVLKQFAMYSSSAMVVVMGVDRVANLMCPVSSASQRRRIRTMLVIAWTLCFLNAIPAGAIFTLATKKFCSDYTVMQCVDLAVDKDVDLGAYYVYTMFVSFFGPLTCILLCYVLIAIALSKMAKISKEAQRRCLNRGSSKSVTERGLDRARRVSLIVTGLITLTFIICWGPYYVNGMIDWFGKKEGGQPESQMSRTARTLMLMSMYLNPMLHPIITIWRVKEIRGNIMTQCRRESNRNGRKVPRRNAPTGIVKMESKGVRLLVAKESNGASETKQQCF